MFHADRDDHLCMKHISFLIYNYLSVLLPPANVVCEGYVFTGVCLSTGGGGTIPACIAGCIPACLAVGGAGLGGGMVPGLGGVCSWGGVYSLGVSGGDPPKLPGPQPGGKWGGLGLGP